MSNPRHNFKSLAEYHALFDAPQAKVAVRVNPARVPAPEPVKPPIPAKESFSAWQKVGIRVLVWLLRPVLGLFSPGHTERGMCDAVSTFYVAFFILAAVAFAVDFFRAL